MRLQYEIVATGDQQLRKTFRSIEAEAERNYRNDLNRDRRRTTSRRQAARRAVSAVSVAERHLSAEKKRLHSKEQRDTERAAKRAADAEIREQKRVAREDARLLKWRQGIRNRHFQQLERQTRMSEARQLATRKRTAARLQSGMGRVASGVTGALGRGLGVATGMATLGATFLAGSSVRKQAGIHEKAALLANQAFDPSSGPSREEIKASALKQAKDLGNSTGIGAGGILDALASAQEISGRLDLAQQIAPLLAEYADATGANINDVGRTGGQIFQSLSARGNLSDAEILSETKEILASMAGQAKKGSIEFADLAQQMGKVMSATAGFDGKASDLAETMGAVAQISLAGGASSPEEAMTAIMRMRDDIIQNNSGFADIARRQGVDVFTDSTKTKVRDPIEIISEMLKISKGDLTKVNELFGIRGYKAVQPFQQAFVDAGGASDPEKGVAMMMRVLDNVRGAKMGESERKDSAALTRSQPGRRFNIEMEKLQDAVGEKLLPELTKLIPKLAELTPVLVNLTQGAIDLANWISDNPWEAAFIGIGALAGKAIVGELVSAGIGSLVSSTLARIMGSAASGGVPGVDVPLGGKGSKLSKSGRWARGLSRVAPVLGGVGLVAGLSYMGMEAAAEKRQEFNAKEMEHAESLGLGKHAVQDGAHGSAFLDPSLQGSPAAIQSQLLGSMGMKKANLPTEQNPLVLEQAAQQMANAAEAQQRAAERLEQGAERMEQIADMNRSNSLLDRGGS